MTWPSVVLWMTFAVLVDRVIVHWERVLDLVGRFVEGRHGNDAPLLGGESRFRPPNHMRLVRPGDDVRWPDLKREGM